MIWHVNIHINGGLRWGHGIRVGGYDRDPRALTYINLTVIDISKYPTHWAVERIMKFLITAQCGHKFMGDINGQGSKRPCIHPH